MGGRVNPRSPPCHRVAGVLAGAATAGVTRAASLPGVPQGLEAVETREKVYMACVSNPTLRKMIYRFNQKKGIPLEIERRYRQWRWLIRHDRETWSRMVANGWVKPDPEAQLAAMWEQDRKWGFC